MLVIAMIIDVRLMQQLPENGYECLIYTIITNQTNLVGYIIKSLNNNINIWLRNHTSVEYVLWALF